MGDTDLIYPLPASPPSAPTADSGATAELGIDISAGQVNRLLIEHEAFHAEQQEVLQAGLETAGMCIRMMARATKDRMGIAL